MDPRNKYYPFEKRPLDYFDIQYKKARATLRKLKAQRTEPSSIFSSRYKQFLDRKHALQTKYKLQKEGKSLDKSSKEYKIIQEYDQERRKEDEVRQVVRTIDDYRMKRYIRTIFLRGYYDMDDQQLIRPELLRSPYDMFWFQKQLLIYYNFSWENLQFGLTISEIEKVLVIISFIRFCFYTVRYDAKSALIISVTGFICALLYQKMLIDVAGLCYIRIYLTSSVFRLGFEQYLQLIHNERTYYHYSLESFRWLDIYPGWLIRLIINSPTLSEIQRYIDDTVMPIVFQYIKIYRKPMESLLFYTLILRVGKRYVPYPIQWHGIVYILYCQCIGNFIFNRFFASMEFLKDFLIPELRLQEIEIIEILHAGFISGFVYMLMLAMLHAVFSQYYYIPILSQNIDAYVGKRPKDSIFSGGYSSWQDEQELFVPSEGDYKIWFGFLGKGPKDRKRKRPRPPKVSVQTNFIFLIIGLLTFYYMWSVQTDNLQLWKY
jgi:hypothetical protein